MNRDVPLFKNLIGKENTETLTFLINDFEKNYLKIKYPKLKINKAYEQFLIDVSENGKLNISEYINKGERKFEKSKLLLDIYKFPDSVWLDSKLVLNMKFIYTNKDGTKSIGNGVAWKPIKDSQNKDSIISSELKQRYLLYSGKFINALDSIKYANNYLYDYVYTKKVAGSISPTILAKNILKNKLDYSNFIIKSIIVLDLVY